MSIETATQFAWRTLGYGDWPPPAPKRGSRFGTDSACWLCGGPTDGVGWWRDQAIKPTFTNANLARVPASRTMCQACVALTEKATWDRYVAEHPEEGLKVGFSMSWRSYSHLFTQTFHRSPNRAGWRDWLLAPPDPPFVCGITETGQKHVLFRGAVSYDRDRYLVQCEEDTLEVDRAVFASCLAAFEALYRLGFSKDQILSGRYAQVQILKVGLGVWKTAEETLAPYRTHHRGLIRLAHFCGQKETIDDASAA